MEAAPAAGALSTFDAECPSCDGRLEPLGGWVWSCPQCRLAFERCGTVLIERVDGGGRTCRPLTA